MKAGLWGNMMKDESIRAIQLPHKMNLAYIIGTYPEISTTFIDREIQALREMGAQIQILSIRRPNQLISQIKDYAQIQKQILYLLPANWLRLFLAHLFFALFHPRSYFSTLFYLLTSPHPRLKLRLKTLLHFGEGVYAAYFLRGKQWDHLHAHFIDRAATVALIVSRLLDIPYSVTAHADDIYNEPVLPYEKLSAAKFSITVSEFNKAHLLQVCPRLEPEKIFVLHPWIDTPHFQPLPTRASKEKFRILSVGRLVENKGHQYLIEACHLLQKAEIDFECQIIGQGPSQSELQRLIVQWNLQDRVHLLGGLPQPEVLKSLSHADVFVLACIVAKNGDRDGMPVAIAEAMAMEVPVISTHIVGIPEMVLPGTGYLVPPNDAQALAEAIQKVYRASAASRVEMGKRGRAVIAGHFDLYAGVQKLAGLFERSVKENGTRHHSTLKMASER